MNVLVVDVGGTHVKVLASGQNESRNFESGPALDPGRMVFGVKKIAADWSHDVVSIGYPGPVLHNRPLAEPHNLGRTWVGFNFEAAFKCPVKSSMTRLCRRWGATTAERCFSSAWGPVWGPQ